MYIQDSVLQLDIIEVLMSIYGIDTCRTHLRNLASAYLSDLATVYSIRFFMKD